MVRFTSIALLVAAFAAVPVFSLPLRGSELSGRETDNLDSYLQERDVLHESPQFDSRSSIGYGGGYRETTGRMSREHYHRDFSTPDALELRELLDLHDLVAREDLDSRREPAKPSVPATQPKPHVPRPQPHRSGTEIKPGSIDVVDGKIVHLPKPKKLVARSEFGDMVSRAVLSFLGRGSRGGVKTPATDSH